MWQQIRSNKIKSAVLTISMLVILSFIGYFIGYAVDSEGGGWIGLVISLIIWFLMAIIAFFKGGQMALSITKAKKIKKEDHPRFWNIVEEMAIAAGLSKIPDVYIIDDPAPNAFATGRDEKTAAIAATTGLLTLLNRDELQGVVAHEIAHIKNRDILFMSMVSVMLGAIVLIAWYGSRMLFFSGSGRSSSNNSGNLALLIIGLVFMILAPIIAQLIYFAVSRKREYLADATGALYTRYPDGLASALEKIGNSNIQIKAANDALAPMYIASPYRKKGHKIDLESLTSTHPPIAERVRILRRMGVSGLVSYEGYEKIYETDSKQRTRADSIIMGNAAMGMTAVSIREAYTEDQPIGLGNLKRTPDARKIAYNSSGGNYIVKKCDDCGAVLKVSTTYQGKNANCPYCGSNINID
ncbi:MAG: M48 family metallopeptidase [Chloroflexi bacterium]|nr:M48 family metallopeptidase [Chloroflexota bacterium]